MRAASHLDRVPRARGPIPLSGAKVGPLARSLLPRLAMFRGALAGVILVTASAAWAVEGEGRPCTSDDQCPRRTICDTDRGRCTPVRRHINLLYMVYRSSDRRFTEVMGLYWHRKGQRGYRVVFPMYWSFWSPGSRHRVLAPFYFDHQLGDRRRLVIPPVELHRTPESSTVRVWPLFFHSDRGEHGHSTTLVPFAHVSREGGRRTVVLPPLLSFARTDDGRQLSQGIIGGLFHWKSEKDRLSLGLLPLFWHRRSPASRFTWVAPLNFHWSDTGSGSSTFLSVPLLLHHHDPRASTTLGLAPLPFYHHRSAGRRRLYLPPISLYHRTGERWLLTLGPTWLHGSPKGGGFGVPPLFADWNDRRRWLVLFPALWHRRSERSTTWVVGPGYYHRRRAEDPPLRPAQDRLAAGLAPLFFYSRRPGATTWVGLAGAFVQHRTPMTSAQVLFPLWWRFRNLELGTHTTVLASGFYRRGRDGWQLGVAPFFFAGRRGERSHVGLLPAFWHQRSAETATTWVAPFNFYRRSGDRRHLVLAPLLFAGWSPERRHLVLPPLLWHFRSPGKSSWFVGPGYYHRAGGGAALDAGLAPLVLYRRRPWGRSLTAAPLLHHSWSADGERSTTWVAPFNFYRRSGDRRHLVLAPLLFAGWSPERRHLVLPPLLWHFRSPGKSSWFVGPGYYHRAGGGAELDAGLAPLVFYRRRPDRRSLTVLPLFHHAASRDGASRLFFSPLFAYKRDAQIGRTQWAVMAPLPYYRRRDLRLHVDALVPLFARWRDLEQRSRTLVVGGPLVLHESPNLGFRTLFPLVWDVKDRASGQRTSALLPLAYRRSDADGGSLSIAGPFFFKRQGENKGWSAGVAPLFFAGRSGERRHQVAFPLFWRFTGPGENVTVAGPVLWRRRGEDRLGGVLPLCLAGRWGDTRFATVPPLLFHHQENRATKERFTLAGLYTGWRDPHGAAHSVWPLFHYRRSGAGEERRTSVSLIPLFFYNRDPESRRLITFAGGFDTTADQTTAVVGPVYVRRGRETSTVAAVPLGMVRWRRGAFSAEHSIGLAPLFYASRAPGRRAVYTPLFGWRKNNAERRSLWYAGTFLASRSGERSTSALVPLVLHTRDHLRARTTVYAFPTYFGRWSEDRSTHVFAPLLWRSRRPAGSTTVVTPALWDVHHFGVSRTTLVFPFYLRRRSEIARTTTHLTPLTWVRRRADGTDAALFPIFWHFGGERRASTVAFPLLWHFRRPGKRTTVVFPVYWDFARGERRTTVVLNTLYRRDRGKRTYDFHFLPLVRVQRKRPQDLKLSFIAGLFGYERAGRNRMVKLFLVPIDITR